MGSRTKCYFINKKTYLYLGDSFVFKADNDLDLICGTKWAPRGANFLKIRGRKTPTIQD